MDMSKVNMHKKMAMTGHYRGGGIAKRGKGKALAAGGLSDAEGRALGRKTPDARGRALRKFGRKDYTPKKGKKRAQGYKAREDESLGMRTGKEKGKRQSMKDRRDESYGAWGKRQKKKKYVPDVAKTAQTPHSKLKTQKELKKITDSAEYKKGDYKKQTEMLGGKVLNYKRGGRANTSRENRLEELGRVDAEKAYTRKGKRNLGAEKRRVVRELNK